MVDWNGAEADHFHVVTVSDAVPGPIGHQSYDSFVDFVGGHLSHALQHRRFGRMHRYHQGIYSTLAKFMTNVLLPTDLL